MYGIVVAGEIIHTSAFQKKNNQLWQAYYKIFFFSGVKSKIKVFSRD